MNVNVIYNSIEVKSNLCTVRPDAPTARFFFFGGGGVREDFSDIVVKFA